MGFFLFGFFCQLKETNGSSQNDVVVVCLSKRAVCEQCTVIMEPKKEIAM